MQSTKPTLRYLAGAFLLAAALAPAGCGGDRSAGSGADATGGGEGTVTDTWSSYCTATFSQDYTALDVWNEFMFTARVGDEYLMAEYGSSFGEDRASLLYLSAGGPADFEITAASGTQGLPFTSDCELGNTTPYYAVFADVSVYAAEDLATKICDLSAGTVLPRDTSVMAGYSATTLGFSGDNTFEVYLNVFSAQCGGAEIGYVSVPETTLFGATTWLCPIQSIVGPA
jgi:hypothetical protein